MQENYQRKNLSKPIPQTKPAELDREKLASIVRRLGPDLAGEVVLAAGVLRVSK